MEIGRFFGAIILAAHVWAIVEISHSEMTTGRKWHDRGVLVFRWTASGLVDLPAGVKKRRHQPSFMILPDFYRVSPMHSLLPPTVS